MLFFNKILIGVFVGDTSKQKRAPLLRQKGITLCVVRQSKSTGQLAGLDRG
jgi:hypothetical protein